MSELEIQHIRQMINESIARTEKISKENHYYPLIVGATVTLAIVAIVKMFL